jgi:hypothetical protein
VRCKIPGGALMAEIVSAALAIITPNVCCTFPETP